MTPEAAVARLVEIISGDDGFTEDSLYAAMAEAGIPGPVADRAYKFAQAAWGRVFLDGMGIQFIADYFASMPQGTRWNRAFSPSSRTSLLPCGWPLRPLSRPGFPKLALMSADENAVNSAFNRISA